MSDDASLAVEAPPEAECPPTPKQRRKEQPADAKPKTQPPYAVVVFNDEEHTFEYVIETLMKVFGYPLEKSYSLTLKIHTEGKVIAWSGVREVAELKRDQNPLGRPGFLRDEEGGLSPGSGRRAAAGLIAYSLAKGEISSRLHCESRG